MKPNVYMLLLPSTCKNIWFDIIHFFSKGKGEFLSNFFGRGDLMGKLITVERAKREIKKLQEYVDLVESYEADTLDKLIIKE